MKLKHLLSLVGMDSNTSVISFGSLRRSAIINAESNKQIKHRKLYIF